MTSSEQNGTPAYDHAISMTNSVAMVAEGLHKLALQRSQEALENGALRPLSTDIETWAGSGDGGFEIRHLVGAPPRHLRAAGPKPNPFRPWDQRLELTRVGREHVLILNKYPVQLGHMLLISQSWQPQMGWLSLVDWTAVCQVNQDTGGLWFFNSGPHAGASQPHRHLQLLPRKQGDRLCPRDAWFQQHLLDATSSRPMDSLERSISIKPLPLTWSGSVLLEVYLDLCQHSGLGSPQRNEKPLAPYNLLISAGWMALIKRSCDEVHGYSVNALGFAGYLLSTERSNRTWLEAHGPEALLKKVVATNP
jgi:ATP adenylyltransferase